MKFFKYLIQTDNDEPDYGVCTEAELIAKLRQIAEDTAAHKCRSLPPDLVEAFDSGSMERTEYEFSNWMTGLAPYSDDYCLPPNGVTVSWEPEPRVQAFVDSLDAALTEADEMKSDGFPEPGWGQEARAAFAACFDTPVSVQHCYHGTTTEPRLGDLVATGVTGDGRVIAIFAGEIEVENSLTGESIHKFTDDCDLIERKPDTSATE